MSTSTWTNTYGSTLILQISFRINIAFTINCGAILQIQNNSGNILLSHVTNYSGNATQTLAESGIISIANSGVNNYTVYGSSYPQTDWEGSTIFINVLH